VSPNPLAERITSSFLWEYGNFNRIIYANWTSSFAIYFVCVIYLIHDVIIPKVKPISKKERLRNLESQTQNLEIQLRIARAKLDKKVGKLVKQDAVLQYLKNEMCPNCLAQVEEYLITR
jgi:hypothetical protein